MSAMMTSASQRCSIFAPGVNFSFVMDSMRTIASKKRKMKIAPQPLGQHCGTSNARA